jgi:O-antigen/teichoic acid export membrane protein
VLARNTALNLFGQIVPLLVAVLAMPTIVSGLGEERFGILGIALAILGYFGEIGFGRATTKFVADAAGNDRPDQLPGLVWGSVGVQLLFGLAGCGIVVATAPILSERILEIPGPLIDEARLSLYILAPVIPAVLVSASLRGVLEAAQRFDLVNAVQVPVRTGQFLLPLMGVLLGWGLPGILALLLSARVAGAVAFLVLSLRVFPILLTRLGVTEVDWRELVSFGGWVTVSGIVSPMLVYLDRFILGALVTMTAVAYYTVPFEVLARVLPIIPAALVATLFPAFSTLTGRREWERMDRLVAGGVKYVMLGVGVVVVFLVAGAHDILGIWMGPEFAENGALAMQILTVGFLINALAWVPHALIQGTGRPDLTAKFHLLELPIYAVLAWVLVGRWGIVGAATAWSLRVTLDAVLLFTAAGYLSRLSIRSLLAERVPQTALLLLTAGAAATAAATWVPGLWLRSSLVLACLTALLVAAWQYSLGAADRERVGRLVRAVRGRG